MNHERTQKVHITPMTCGLKSSLLMLVVCFCGRKGKWSQTEKAESTKDVVRVWAPFRERVRRQEDDIFDSTGGA